jgi:methionyl-tRNA formyltransferase
MRLRVLFAGSPEIALPCLEALAESGRLVGVLSNPPAPSGRGRQLAETPIAAAAKAFLPPQAILCPERLDSGAREEVAALAPDLLAVFAYGKIFGPRFLALFPSGAVNVHPSLLPRWRGPSPIQAAIMARDSETGISIQRVALEMDSGDILAQERIPLSGRETAGSLASLVASRAPSLLMEVITRIEAGSVEARPQDRAAARYCRLLGPEDREIDWSLPADDIDAKVRAFSPEPGAFSFMGGKRLDILECAPSRRPREGGRLGEVVALDKSEGIIVQTGMGFLALSRLRLETKKAMWFKDFANGCPGLLGSVLGRPRGDQ